MVSMAISPVEMISMVPKSQEASFMKQTEMHKPNVEQQVMAAKMNQEIKHNSTQTVATNKSVNPEYRYDAKEKGNNSYQGKEQKKKDSKKNETNKDNNNGLSSSFGRIDIRI